MKQFLVTLVATLVCAGGLRAAEPEVAESAASPDNTRANSGYAQVSNDDPQMARAVEDAQRTLGFFMAAVRAKKDGDTILEIKKAFVDGDKVEHLWIKRVTYDGKNFHGQIDNQPAEIGNVHAGERVTVAPREVDDWMFLKDGKLMGGYTTRVLYARLSAEDKARFDKKADYKVE
jgi:uncharacterized protein YegJ (DUF2314 family)